MFSNSALSQVISNVNVTHNKCNRIFLHKATMRKTALQGNENILTEILEYYTSK